MLLNLNGIRFLFYFCLFSERLLRTSETVYIDFLFMRKNFFVYNFNFRFFLIPTIESLKKFKKKNIFKR